MFVVSSTNFRPTTTNNIVPPFFLIKCFTLFSLGIHFLEVHLHVQSYLWVWSAMVYIGGWGADLACWAQDAEANKHQLVEKPKESNSFNFCGHLWQNIIAWPVYWSQRNVAFHWEQKLWALALEWFWFAQFHFFFSLRIALLPSWQATTVVSKFVFIFAFSLPIMWQILFIYSVLP